MLSAKANVAMAKYAPRSLNAVEPIINAIDAAMMPARGTQAKKEPSNLLIPMAVAYDPTPKYTTGPKSTYPVYPQVKFQHPVIPVQKITSVITRRIYCDVMKSGRIDSIPPQIINHIQNFLGISTATQPALCPRLRLVGREA